MNWEVNLTDISQVRDRTPGLSKEHTLAQLSGNVASMAYAKGVGCTTLTVSTQRNLIIAN
jgi:hypothetical protein